MAWLKKRNGTFYICWNASDGTEKRKSLKTTKKTVAERELTAYRAKELEGMRLAPSVKNMPCDEFWKQYAKWVTEHREPRTLETNKRYWDMLLAFSGAQRLGDITAKEFERFLEWERDKKYHVTTIINSITNIRTIFNRAIKWKCYSGPNPTATTEKPRRGDNDITVFTLEQLEKILEAARETKDRDLILTVLLGGFQGLRKAEIAAFRLESVNREAKNIHIREYDIDGYRFHIKTHERRVIPLSPRLTAELPEAPQGFLFEPKRNGQGNHYRIDKRRSLSAILGKCGLPTGSPYQNLRIAYGNALFRRGISLDQISKVMGNSIETLRKWYIGDLEFSADMTL